MHERLAYLQIYVTLQPEDCPCNCTEYLSNAAEEDDAEVTVTPPLTTATKPTTEYADTKKGFENKWTVSNEDQSTNQAIRTPLYVQRSCGIQLIAGKITRNDFFIFYYFASFHCPHD